MREKVPEHAVELEQVPEAEIVSAESVPHPPLLVPEKLQAPVERFIVPAKVATPTLLG